MKKYIIIASLAVGALAYGQINIQSPSNPVINKENPFLDASGYNVLFPNSSIGKGLYFPTTDLTTWEFKTSSIDPQRFSTYFDGMIVYNSASGQTIEDTTKGGKRVKVEPGFYYFKNPNQAFPNGSIANGEWIRLNDSFANEQEWVYDSTNNQINLKRSGQNTGFTNKVFYDAINGGFYNYNDSELDALNDNGINKPNIFKKEGIKHYLQSNSKSIAPYDYTTEGGDYSRKILSNNILYLDETSASTLPLIIAGNRSGVVTSINNATPTRNLIGGSFYVDKQDNQETNYVIGGNNNAFIRKGSAKFYGFGANSSVFVNSSEEQNVIASERHQTVLGSSAGKIKDLNIIRGAISLLNENNSTIEQAYGINYTVSTQEGVTATINNLFGFYYNSNGIGSNTTVNNSYGLFMQDVKGATTNNYAIFTKAGKIRFGDNVGIGVDKPTEKLEVDGNIKSRGIQISSDTEELEQGSLRGRLSYLSDGTDWKFAISKNQDGAITDQLVVQTNGNVGIGTTNPTEKLEVVGAVKAESFKGANGATIFPDYVFENYYKGTSSSKTDYNFKNLNQIENFVKINGHLPGYQSAKEVKAQGYIDVLSTQLTNVEKIEELYLHTIEQEKAIKAKDAKINILEKDVQELKVLVQQLLNK